MSIIVCKREDGASRVFWDGKAWAKDRARAKEYATREAALKVHPDTFKIARPEGYRTPTVVER